MTTGIEWTDETWNPVVGCAHVSAGCDHCYAAREASGRLRTVPAYAGLAEDGRFTGAVRLLPERLDQPLRWRKPRRVFVNSMSDLFHKDVPDDYIGRVWLTMAWTSKEGRPGSYGRRPSKPRHTFQVLTKRPQRMARWVRDCWGNREWRAAFLERCGDTEDQDLGGWFSDVLPNVWLGTSVETQRYADLRIPHLLETPAAVRFLSVEPLLGPVDLFGYLDREPQPSDGPEYHADHRAWADRPHVDWVIVGGESGPAARPMHPDWARQVRDQVTAAGVPFFFKQWGEWAPAGYEDGTHLIHAGEGRGYVSRESATRRVPVGRSGYREEDLIDQGHPYWARIRRPGKKFAGRELDGRTWEETPAY